MEVFPKMDRSPEIVIDDDAVDSMCNFVVFNSYFKYFSHISWDQFVRFTQNTIAMMNLVSIKAFDQLIKSKLFSIN